MAIGPRLAKRAPWTAALTLVAAALGGVAILASRPRPTIVRAVDPKNLEQTALEEIVRSYWGPALFESSEPCAPSGFDPDVPLMVFRDRPGYWATMLDFAPLAGIDVTAAVRKKDGLYELMHMGVVDEIPFSIDISAFPFMEPTPPTGEWPSDEKYLLRFSNRVRFEDRTYLKAGVTGGSKFAGTWWILFQFDASGRILRSERRPSGCDEERS